MTSARRWFGLIAFFIILAFFRCCSRCFITWTPWVADSRPASARANARSSRYFAHSDIASFFKFLYFFLAWYFYSEISSRVIVGKWVIPHLIRSQLRRQLPILRPEHWWRSRCQYWCLFKTYPSSGDHSTRPQRNLRHLFSARTIPTRLSLSMLSNSVAWET